MNRPGSIEYMLIASCAALIVLAADSTIAQQLYTAFVAIGLVFGKYMM